MALLRMVGHRYRAGCSIPTRFFGFHQHGSARAINEHSANRSSRICNNGDGDRKQRPAIPTIRWDQAGFFLWLLGTATVMTYHAVQHFRFMKMINRWCEDITNHATVDSLQKLKKELGISRDVQLKVCPFVQSPMLIGLRRPAIILPSASFRPHEFGFHFEA